MRHRHDISHVTIFLGLELVPTPEEEEDSEPTKCMYDK